MDSPLSRELRVAIAAAQHASRLSAIVLAQTQHDDGPSRMSVVSKDDLSPVTIADFAIQALLACAIHHAFPHDRFVGEESADALRANPPLLDRVCGALQQLADHSDMEPLAGLPESPERVCEAIDWCGHGRPDAASGGGRIWVFDPIDGTENYVRGLVYAVNVALLDDAGRQALAVVACPNMSPDVAFPATDASLGKGFVVFAVRGHGAFVGGLDQAADHARRLPRHADDAAELRSVSCNNSSGLPAVHQAVARELCVAFPGSTLLPWVVRYVLMALNVGNSTWWVYKSRQRLAKIWDHAGAMLLFEEVGGKVTDVDGRDIDLTAGRTMVANYGIVAAPRNLHERLLSTVQRVLREQNPELLSASG